MNPLYELVPISESPIRDGYYTVIDPADPSQDEAFYFLEGEWFQSEHDARVNENHFSMDVDGCHWLRPINPETLKAMIREELGFSFIAGQQHQYQKEHGGFYQPDCESYINSVIDKLFKQ